MDSSNNVLDINRYKLEKGPSTIYYIPDFVTETEEEDLLKAVNSAPKPKWTQLLNRRLQNWGGVPHPNGMLAEEIPQWLKLYTERIRKLELFDGKIPNHVLINEYLPGQGIMPHLDGPLFFPTITTINLGSHTVLNLYHPLKDDNQDGTSSSSWNDRLAYSLLLQPRSVLILKDEAYNYYLHGIEEIQEDVVSNITNLESCTGVMEDQVLERGTRVSLTIRHVPKTTKGVIKLRL